MKIKGLISIALNVYNLPLFREIRGTENYITYGLNNTYPNYLTDMYNQSAVHNSILTAKVNYIVGRGLELEGVSSLFNKPNPHETIDAIFNKVTSDYELQNGYAIEVIKKGKKITEIYHMDFGRLRRSIDGKGYWYSVEWTYINAEGERCKKINPKKILLPNYETGGDHERSVFVFMKYRPDYEYYPLPDYVGALSAIETDVEISNYHLNNIKNGFSAGTMIAFNNGVPDDDADKDSIIDDIKAKATGSNKAGEVFVTFSVDKEHAPEVTPMQPNNLDKQYELLAKHVQDTIFIGHKVTNPALFGVKISGQLGGQSKDELSFAYEQFKETYIIHRQKDLLWGLKYILDDAGSKVELEVKELRPIMPELKLSESTIIKYLDNKALAEYIEKQYGIKTTENPVEEVKMSAYKPSDYFKNVGKVYQGTNLESNEVEAHEDVKFKYQDVSEFQFAEGVDKNAERILQVLKEFPTATDKQVSKILDLPEKIVTTVIGGLMDNGYLDKKKNEYIVSPKGSSVVENIPKRQSLKIVYSYELRPDAPALLTESREFCQEMTAMSRSGKRWTKEEIEGLQNDMSTKGFITDIENVWKYRGGWYRDPNKDVAVPFCRHRWVQHIIVE